MKKDHGYIVLDMRSGAMDGTYYYKADARAVCESFADMFPQGEWVLVQRVGHFNADYPGIPDARWLWNYAPRFYGYTDMEAACAAYDARRNR